MTITGLRIKTQFLKELQFFIASVDSFNIEYKYQKWDLLWRSREQVICDIQLILGLSTDQ